MMTLAGTESVVITGASTGIGRACALHMDRLGWRVFAGVRREADAASLRSATSDNLVPILLDVTDARSIKEAVDSVSAALDGSGLSALVNNAGIPYGGPVEFLDLAEVRHLFEVNFFGVMAVTRIYSTLVFLVAAAVAVLVGFSPKFGALVASIPPAVLGGLSIVLFGLIAATGARIWIENRVDFSRSRNLLTAAVALTLGAGDLVLKLGGFSLGGIGTATLAAIVVYQLLGAE